MEIKNLRKIDKGVLKAFFTLSTDHLEINDVKLCEGRDGKLYAAMPQKEYLSNGQKKWSNIVYIKSRDLLDKIGELARQEYFKGQEPENQGIPESDIPF
jgi:DNA-binding cell septation regulator SpoVG